MTAGADPGARSTPEAGRLVVLARSSLVDGDPEPVEAALAAMREHGDVLLVRTHDEADLDRRVVEHASERLVVVGGDGSVHALVQSLRRTGCLADVPSVAVVPLGTGNDLARGVGIPLDPAGAGHLAATGRVERMALLLDDDDQVVVNAVHVGAGAEATSRTGAKSMLGRYAYYVGALVTGLRADGWQLRVRVDGRELHDGVRPVFMAGVGLGRTIGGGAPLLPGADPAGGTAEVVVSLATGWLARVVFAAALRLGRHHERDDVLRDRGREITIEVVAGKPFLVDTDGEVAGPYRSRHWRLVPSAWPLVVPPGR